MSDSLIVTLQAFPTQGGGIRIDLVSVSPPEGESPAFQAMVRELGSVAEKIIAIRGRDLLESRTPHIEGCPASPPQTQNLDEA